MRYHELLEYGQQILETAGIADAKIDAWFLLEHLSGLSRASYFLRQDDEASETLYDKYTTAVEQRKNHIPLQHIIGTQEFMGLDFIVNEHVLIPRQDTETLVELALPRVSKKRVLDVCTGSGCIAVSLAKLGNPSLCHGVDLSEEALKVAKENAKRLDAEVCFFQSDLCLEVSGQYDVIVSNPPYIPPAVIESLEPEVKDYEPMMALDGGPDGLVFYRRLALEMKTKLTPNGLVFLEIGHDQGLAVKDILEQEGFTNVVIHQDLANKDRVISATWTQ